MSFSTTMYIRWIEAEYDRVFSQNLASIQGSNQLESIVWRSLSEWTNPALDANQLRERQSQNSVQMKQILENLRETVYTEEEGWQQAQLEEAVNQICAAMDVEGTITRTTQTRSPESLQRLFEHAATVTHLAQEVRNINEALIQASRHRMSETQGIVMLTRMSMLLIGPLLGVFLGWRVARRLQSSVAKIAVTLSGSTLPPDQLGLPDFTVEITRESSFEDVRRQAERVVDRLRQVVGQLQTARREVIQAERLAAVGELAAGVAHELRNPLTSVKLLLQHASRQPEAAQIPTAKLPLVLAEVGRMEATIQGLLDFARTPAVNRVRHDLRETLHRSLNLVHGRLSQETIEVSTVISEDPLIVDGDSEQLNQVFVNVLLNSIEAMPNGGQLKVTAYRTAENSAEIIVSDSGSGISGDMMSRMFEPFSTTKERGTGLGLAISHRIISEHQGSIHASSEPSAGATFTISLPLLRVASA
ncbi:MAG: sensor histidine kinase [Planctomycetota bacterium]